eukprot:965130_1
MATLKKNSIAGVSESFNNNTHSSTESSYNNNNINIIIIAPNEANLRDNQFDDHTHDIYVEHTRSTSRQQHLSPISSGYSKSNRIGTSLNDDDGDAGSDVQCTTPLRHSISNRKRKYSSSSISPTFQPIYHSPSQSRIIDKQSASCDRYTPTHGDINRYAIRSLTTRFVHNNAAANMTSYTNTIRPPRRKRRKLGQNYSGTNDDPQSLSHRLSLKLSQHAYNQVLQSELLGFSDQNNEDDTQRNDNIPSINISNENEHNEEEVAAEEDTQQNIVYGSPSLPNRRIVRSTRTTTKRRMNTTNTGAETKRNGQPNAAKYCNVSHHPLCPCDAYNKKNRNTHHSASSDEDNDSVGCVCDSITSNVATNFLQTPQRTLRYDKKEPDNEQESMTPIKQCSQSVLSGSRKSMRNIAAKSSKVFRCEYCGKTFKTMLYLKNHIRIHTGDRPFVCGVCKSAFKQQAHLTMHGRIHTGETFSCNLCNKSYSRKTTLKTHIKKEH